MKLVNLWMCGGLCALALGLSPANTWANRPVGGVTGAVTATPIAGQIEVNHVVYHIKAKTPADQNFRRFTTGVVVDLVLDGPAGSPTTSVISITAHAGP